MLHQFKNILVAVPEGGDDPGLLQRAAELAKANKGRLTLMDVIQLPVPPNTTEEMGAPQISPAKWKQIHRALLTTRENELKTLAKSIHGLPKSSVSVKVVEGQYSVEITRDIVNKNRDLLMKVATPEKGMVERMLGGLDTQLIRRCPCPVWIRKPRQRKPYRRIMVALDPDPDDKVRDKLNLNLLDLATSLARMVQSELFVVHAWGIPGEATLRTGELRLNKKNLDALLRHEKARRKKRLDEILAHHPEQDFKRHVLLTKGYAPVVIPRLAQQKKIDLVIMGTVCRTGLKGFFIGNTAETVLQQIQCAVLTIKPEGFQTPLDL